MVVLGCDVGGTFTDCVLVDAENERVGSLKVASTPADPSQAAAAGLAALLRQEGVDASAVERVVHGTTVGTNAVLTRNGPRVALVTNAGFEDFIEIGRQDRPALYDATVQRPLPLAARDARFGVVGRLGPHGETVTPLDAASVQAAAQQAARFDACAVVLLHAYANGDHEAAVAAALKEAAPDLAVATSHATAPEFREFERATTTLVNAFLLPVMDGYLQRFDERLRALGVHAPFFVFESAGGVLTPQAARAKPVLTVLSGPAGGAAACGVVAAAVKERHVLGLDMGGTSTDLSIVVDGAPKEAVEGAIAGWPLRVPMLDVATLGAGGGSLVDVDAGGFLRVGPASAGAEPGPACYGRGGDQATVTDAHVVLGHVASLLGGTFPLDADAARRAFKPVGDALGIDVQAAARAVIDVTNESVTAAARVAVARHGLDPRDFALAAFGGAGPLHAVAVARGLGMPRVIVPADSGVLSAVGMLAAPLRRDGAVTWLGHALKDAPRALAELANATTASLVADGAPPDPPVVRFACDARYEGQAFELTLPLQNAEAVVDVPAAFHAAHAAAFGHSDETATVEVVHLRVTVTLPTRSGAHARAAGAAGAADSAAAPPAKGPHGTRESGDGAGSLDVWQRAELRVDDVVAGPAVIEDTGSSTLLPTGVTARVHASGALAVVVGA